MNAQLRSAVTRQFGRVSNEGGSQPENPGVTGKPRLWLRAEGLTLFATALLLYPTTHQPWWLVPAVILLPDLFMAGYVGGSRLGAAVYNAGHSYPDPGPDVPGWTGRAPPADPGPWPAVAGAHRHGSPGRLRAEIRQWLPVDASR